MSDLYKIRALSFMYGLGSLIILAIGGVIISPDFATLVKTNFGDSALVGFLLLLAPEVARHLRNLAALKKLGSHEKVILI